MTRMKTRMEAAAELYPWEEWSFRYARNLWNYGCHIAKADEKSWSRLLILENKIIKQDPSALFHPYRHSGRPKLRWDDYFSNFFVNIFRVSLIRIGYIF